jgi:CheY-like chemotaxis protein
MKQGSHDLLYILLADDDADDRMFFEDAIYELQLNLDFRTVKDGMELINYLNGNGIILPQILFLDLNMPFKNGFQCLDEIRSIKAFDDMFIILYSTTARPSDIDSAFEKGASMFIQKPNSYSDLKQILLKLFTTDVLDLNPSKESFVFKL